MVNSSNTLDVPGNRKCPEMEKQTNFAYPKSIQKKQTLRKNSKPVKQTETSPNQESLRDEFDAVVQRHAKTLWELVDK